MKLEYDHHLSYGRSPTHLQLCSLATYFECQMRIELDGKDTTSSDNSDGLSRGRSDQQGYQAVPYNQEVSTWNHSVRLPPIRCGMVTICLIVVVDKILCY